MKNNFATPIPINAITITDTFWTSYMSLIRLHVIPYQWEALNDRIEGADPSYCIANFQVASGEKEGQFQGMVFQDSDIYKWLEAVAYSLMWHPDETLEATADEAIRIISAAQQPDGYLNTYYIINGLDKRFTNLKDHHELYCLGHMIEAAVAYYQATGKKLFLDTTIKYVECVDTLMGPESDKTNGYPGHEVIEMALVKLYQLTNEPKFLKLAQYFIDERGKKPLYFSEENKENDNKFYWHKSYFQYQYYQAGIPVLSQEKAEGHAVRAVYLYSGMADVAKETNNQALFETCEKLWNNITQKQMYITGGIGSSEYGEAFTFDYDLPNDTVYAETCASVGLSFFAKRMFEITKDSRYSDVLERELYNGTISGMSLDGQSFFYVNPLEVVPEASEKDQRKKHVTVERQKWFGCACCPPNLARLISSVGSYAYAFDDDTIFMNLFIGGHIQVTVKEVDIKLNVTTNYPWDEAINITLDMDTSTEFSYALRIPDWCHAYSISVNNETITCPINMGYAYITRLWNSKDQIQLILKMPVRLIAANPNVREDLGKVAVMRGPLVYCLEEVDNGKGLHRIHLDQAPSFKVNYEPDLLNGITSIETDAWFVSDEEWDNHTLYKTYKKPKLEAKKIKLIPYYSWTNRTPGEMSVWIKTL